MRRGLRHYPTVDLILLIAALVLVSAIMVASLFFA